MMKKSDFIIIGMAFTVTLILSSCGKEDTSLENNELKLIYELNNIEKVPNNQNLNDLMQNPNDKDDEKISYQLYNLSLAIETLIKDPVFTKDVITLARENKNQTVSISKLANLRPEIKTIINNALKSSNTSIEELDEIMTRDNGQYIEHYTPSIFIPNLAILDENLQPIISPNIVANSDENPELEDKIVAWYFTGNGAKKEILISEEESLKTLNPLFILDNAEDVLNTKKETLETVGTNQNANSRVAAPNKYNANEVRINNRYERSGKSEFAMHAIVIDANGNQSSVFGNYKILYNIKKKDINKTLTPGLVEVASDYSPIFSYHYAYNTYERDWNNSSKGLGSSIGNGTTVNLSGRRRYSSEWYGWPNTSVNIPGAPLGQINGSGFFGSRFYNNSKGHLNVVYSIN